jgi:hypothetical protein
MDDIENRRWFVPTMFRVARIWAMKRGGLDYDILFDASLTSDDALFMAKYSFYSFFAKWGYPAGERRVVRVLYRVGYAAMTDEMCPLCCKNNWVASDGKFQLYLPPGTWLFFLQLGTLSLAWA